VSVSVSVSRPMGSSCHCTVTTSGITYTLLLERKDRISMDGITDAKPCDLMSKL
jgi:hypothetical protein